MVPALIYAASGVVASVIIWVVAVAGVLMGRLWDLVMRDDACDRVSRYRKKRR